MSDIYVIWAKDPNRAQARLEDIVSGDEYRVLRRGVFPLAQAEDLDSDQALVTSDTCYCIVFELQ